MRHQYPGWLWTGCRSRGARLGEESEVVVGRVDVRFQCPRTGHRLSEGAWQLLGPLPGRSADACASDERLKTSAAAHRPPFPNVRPSICVSECEDLTRLGTRQGANTPCYGCHVQICRVGSKFVSQLEIPPKKSQFFENNILMHTQGPIQIDM